MLYIFRVDTGDMMTFDMSLTTETVQTLKEHVERAIRIPADKQVMLISGGECLDSTKRVCSYSSGTDTNPIYLFSRSMNDPPNPQSGPLDFSEEQELLEKERICADLPPSFQVVNKRAQLAQQFSDSAVNLLRISERLVLDQHNQHQGWAAVVANCEDLLAEFRGRFQQLKCDFSNYLLEREYFQQFLEKFRESLLLLQKIPLLPQLSKSDNLKKYLPETCEEKSQSSLEQISACDMKLFDWIGRDEHGNDLEMLYTKCLSELDYYNEEAFCKISAEVDVVVNSADQPSMKEIKGLGPRLFRLDRLIQDAKKKVQEQTISATSITKNQSRVQNLKDSSILPDLCASHVKQLNVMAQNHESLIEICDACHRAKIEFNENLNIRLPWVKHIHNNFQKMGDQIDIFSETIANLRYKLGILEQVDIAPVAYLSCIAEIVRRKSFSQAFLTCTSKLVSCHLKIHNEEVSRRKEFRSKFDGHFIHLLFPGMGDQPPGYGIDTPAQFDTGLPELTQEDIKFLKAVLPEMEDYLNITESSDSFYISLFNSISHREYETGREEVPPQIILKDAIVQSETSDLVQKKISKVIGETSSITVHGRPYLKDIDKGCESETDTEEFEKVGQSPLELNFEKDILSLGPSTQDASTLTEDNLEISRSEFDKMKSLVLKMGTLASQTIVQLKCEFDDLKVEHCADKSVISDHLQKLINSFENLSSQQEDHNKILIHRMSSSHANEINDFRKLTQVKNEEIKNLRSNIVFLEQKMKTINQELIGFKEEAIKNEQKIVTLDKNILSLELEKEKSIKEVTERLNREHKDEIKTLKARFKLMTMERTPSDNSLEKTLEFSSLTNHESIINQMTENFEIEKEKAVKETISKETEKWKKVIEQLKEDFEVQKTLITTSLVDRISEEKDNQIEVLQNREKLLMSEIDHYTSTIEQLTTTEVNDFNLEMMDKIEALENEKSFLSTELQKMTNQLGMSASMGSYLEGKIDSATSPIRQRKSISKSFSLPSGKMNKLSLDYLKRGDYVVVVWDVEHESFRIAQHSPVMYFLHSDCIKLLNLKISDESPKSPNKFYCLAEYVDREYCHARKSKNRYKVPRGTRFFHVKVKPLDHENMPEPISKIDIPMTQSHIVPDRTSSGSTTEPEFHSLPSSPKIRSGMEDSSFESSSETTVHNIQSESDNRNVSEDDNFMTALYFK